MKRIINIGIVVSLAVVGINSIFLGEVKAAGAKCYNTTTSGVVEFLTDNCVRSDMRALGFVMRGLPNPLEADKCYLWGASAESPGQEVPCDRNDIVNAAPFGSTTPPPLSFDDLPDPPPPPAGGSTGRFTCTGTACVTDNPITRFLITVVNFLSALVGIIVIAVIIIAGIQYTTSGGNPQQAAQAKKRIINAVTALVAFFFLFAILQWLIPGGIFKS